jgi:translation initiation factor 2 subunit 1
MEFFDSNIRAEKLLDAAIKKSKIKAELKEIVDSIMKSYSSVYDFAYEVYEKGEVIAEKVGMPKKLATTYHELVKISLKPSKVTVRAEMKLVSFAPNGVESIKEVLSEPEGAAIKYLGAPRYMISLEDENFKSANKKMNSILANAAKKAKQMDVSFEYEIMKNEG